MDKTCRTVLIIEGLVCVLVLSTDWRLSLTHESAG